MDRENVKRVPSRHQCMDCGHKFSIGRAAMWKAARPKCPACGSGRLEPVEAPVEAKKEEEKKP